jgi:hypothetical protein
VSVYIQYDVAQQYCLLVHWCETAQLAREGLSVKHEPLEANSKILGGPRQIKRMLMEESSKSINLTLDGGHGGRIREVLQEDGCSRSYDYTIML